MFLNQLDRLLTFYSLLERNITILQMPQSLYYSPEAISLGLDIKEADIIKHAIESTVGLSRGKTKVILTWREESSFFRAQELYPFVDNRLIPDIAFMIGPQLLTRPRGTFQKILTSCFC
jgi:exopolysaccharide biosynthesis predicted pyruvyltransferase EpsI